LDPWSHAKIFTAFDRASTLNPYRVDRDFDTKE